MYTYIYISLLLSSLFVSLLSILVCVYYIYIYIYIYIHIHTYYTIIGPRRAGALAGEQARHLLQLLLAYYSIEYSRL